MELWDAYDREGNRLNQDLTRGVPVPEGLYHMVCSVIVRHADGDFLLMKRHPNKPSYPGIYEPGAGGAAQKGETALDCIRRELWEETGIRCDRFTLISQQPNDSARSILFSFCCTTDCPKDSVRLQEGETVDYLWVSPARLDQMIADSEIVPLMQRRLARYFAFIRRQ